MLDGISIGIRGESHSLNCLAAESIGPRLGQHEIVEVLFLLRRRFQELRSQQSQLGVKALCLNGSTLNASAQE